MVEVEDLNLVIYAVHVVVDVVVQVVVFDFVVEFVVEHQNVEVVLIVVVQNYLQNQLEMLVVAFKKFNFEILFFYVKVSTSSSSLIKYNGIYG